MPLKSIVWLASYPKSGNTWVRIFLANYLLNTKQPIPINQVHKFGIGDAIASTYRIVGKGKYDPKDTHGHLRMREQVLKGIVNNDADINFVKTHNLKKKAMGVELIVKRYTRSGIYILRDPRDVCISYARHYGVSVKKAAHAISDTGNAVLADAASVTQYLGSWSDHVRSWTKTRDFPLHILRYEDMQADPVQAFSGVLEHIGVPVEEERLDRAVRFSSFDELQAQEAKTGFIERSSNTDKFFHSGVSRQWDGVLDPEDLDTLSSNHGDVMRDYGYL